MIGHWAFMGVGRAEQDLPPRDARAARDAVAGRLHGLPVDEDEVIDADGDSRPPGAEDEGPRIEGAVDLGGGAILGHCAEGGVIAVFAAPASSLEVAILRFLILPAFAPAL